MKTTNLLKKAFRSRNSNRRRKPRREHISALEHLENRQLLTATMAWDGDTLKIEGTEDSDFLAIQQDEFALRVFTEESVFTELDGRALDTASSVEVFGMGGNDVLLSYQTEAPVNLNGGVGNDFLFTNRISDVLVGGEGFDWIQSAESTVPSEDSFGIPELDVNVDLMNINPEFDADGRLNLDIKFDGNVDASGTMVAVTGSAGIDEDGVAITATGSIEEWDEAFGIPELELRNTSLTIAAGTNVRSGDGYDVSFSSQLDVSGTVIDVDGAVAVSETQTSADFSGSVSDWDNAFGIEGFHLTNASLAGTGIVGVDDVQSFQVDVSGAMTIDGTDVNVAGHVGVSQDEIDAEFFGSVQEWDTAFGIEGLDLVDGELHVVASSDRRGLHEIRVDVMADMEIEETDVAVSGSVELTPERIDAVFSGSIDNWDDAFGIAGFDLLQSDLSVRASSDRADEFALNIDIDGKMNVSGTPAAVSGSVELTPERTAVSLSGKVDADWDDAFGISGLDLNDALLAVDAVRDSNATDKLVVELDADLDIAGQDVDVTGHVQIDDDDIHGTLAGVVAGTWVGAFGMAPLHLQDTVLSVTGRKSSTESELSMTLAAGMDMFGTDLSLNGSVNMNADGLTADLSASLTGDWIDALGVPGLQLRDTDFSFSSTSGSSEVDVAIDTDLQLFGDYISVLGDLNISPEGIAVNFSPPGKIDFTDLLGIPGFSLENADLDIGLAADGLSVTIESTMEMGNVEVDYTGAFTVNGDDVSASLTGRVDEWDNAFDVPGLDLNDVVLTLGAEAGKGGASMFIGLGAGMAIGASELSVAGLVGFGATGWEVAFRGELDSLEADDLIDFANSMNQAADPTAAAIPEGALGDLELRTAFVNFAPKGGNEALGIEDGFGIGGAFYNDGELLGSGTFVVDLANGVFEAGLDIPKIKLGPVELSDVVVDVRMSPDDAYFRAEGTAELLGAEVKLKGEVSSDSFSLEGHAAMDFQGFAATVTFYVDQNGVRFVASAGGGALNAIKDNATAGIRAAANVAQQAIDAAQDVVDDVSREARKLQIELDGAREEAQKEVDEVKAKIAKAKAIVDSALSSRNYWQRTRDARYRAWRSAVSATRRAKWWQKPAYKAREASRYASYAYARGRYSAQTAIHKAAAVSYNAVRSAAGWVLDTAGVEANPEVLRIKALLTVANVGVGVAETALNGLESANAALFKTLDTIDSLKVRRITLAGNLANYKSAGLSISIDTEFDGRSRTLNLHASTDDLFKQLGKEVFGGIL